MTARRQPWHRLLWGVAFTARRGDPEPMLIGSTWHEPVRQRKADWPGEPTRALLFTTRAGAADWCRETNAKWSDYPVGHICRKWRVRPVRVRETVTEVK